MSSFDVDSLLRMHPIASLPEHYLESTQFKSWIDLFPEESDFHIPDHLYVEDLTISSQTDLDKINEAECAYGFTPKVHKIIFRNTERYWSEDPNSSPFILPQEGKSWFGDQLIVLFSPSSKVV